MSLKFSFLYILYGDLSRELKGNQFHVGRHLQSDLFLRTVARRCLRSAERTDFYLMANLVPNAYFINFLITYLIIRLDQYIVVVIGLFFP
jgi:hypothetical protein